MYYALVYYTDLPGLDEIRKRHDPFYDLINDHITIIFPVPASEINLDDLKDHFKKILQKWSPFDIHLKGFHKSWDHWLFLILQEGNERVIELHDDLYSGILKPFLREDIPFVPHVGLVPCFKGDYDIKDPRELELDEEKYNMVLKEAQDLNIDYWRKLDKLYLIRINDSFKTTENIDIFKLMT